MSVLQAQGARLEAKAQALRQHATDLPRYSGNQSADQAPGLVSGWVLMQNDVPVWDAKALLPHWVETKCMSARAYGQTFRAHSKHRDGSDVHALNQLLKYQFALERGWISGATVIVRGRVHPAMWSWMTEGVGRNGSLIPGVEVIWEVPLPSGRGAWAQVKIGAGPALWRPPRLSTTADVDAWTCFQAMLAPGNSPAALMAQEAQTADEVPGSLVHWKSWRRRVLGMLSMPPAKSRPGRHSGGQLV